MTIAAPSAESVSIGAGSLDTGLTVMILVG